MSIDKQALEKAEKTKELLTNLNKVEKDEEFNKVQKSDNTLEDLKK